MVIKVAGLTLIFFVCAAAGFRKSTDLSKRVRQLESFIGALNLISTEIRYFASPVNVIISKIDALEEYEQLKVFGICKENIKKIKNFPKAWELSVQQSKPYLALNTGDIETILWFGKVLGTTDVEGQIANCERYAGLLEQRLSLARENKTKLGRMYSSLGILAGVFFIVLLF